MNLLIDAGNSSSKIGVSQNGEILFSASLSPSDVEGFAKLFDRYPSINKCILSSVIVFPTTTLDFLKSRAKLLLFDTELKTPLINKYSTPLTLGRDRLA